MAKARAIVKRRKAVRNIRKITKTMQMIATAKFQKSLKRAVGTKSYTLKVRELVRDLAASIANVEAEPGRDGSDGEHGGGGDGMLHPLLRRPGGAGAAGAGRNNRIALVVITSNRGLAGAYNGSVLRAATAFIRQQEAAGKTVELYVTGKKGLSYFAFQKRPVTQKVDVSDQPAFTEANPVAERLMDSFVRGHVDAVYVAYMNFISTGVQKPDVMTLLPLAGAAEATEHLAQQVAEKEAQARAGALDARRSGTEVRAEAAGTADTKTVYDFSPGPRELMAELLPRTVKTALFQAFLDATTSEHVARMVAMKSATDNADKMAKALTMQYNRARQSQITTELSEIMGGVEAMKG